MALTMPRPPAGSGHSVGFLSAVETVHDEDGRAIVALRGEADVSTRAALCAVLLSQVNALGGGDVVIDLADTTFIDTATVRMLAIGQQLLDRQGRILTFRSPSRLAARVLQLFGLTNLVETQVPVEL
jgi:anti-anti-sigma factor